MNSSTEMCWLCMSTHAASEGITHYTRRFECGACSTEWTDKWCSDCDDECPCCGTVMTSLEVLEEDILESAR